jgi:hypothetical protein
LLAGAGDSNLRMAESNALPFHLATPHHTACLRRHGARTIAAASTWRAFHRLGLLLRASARDCCSISQHLQLAGTSLEVDVIDHNGAILNEVELAAGLRCLAPGDLDLLSLWQRAIDALDQRSFGHRALQG